MTATTQIVMPTPASQPASGRIRDRAVPIVALMALLVSVGAFILTVRLHAVLAYNDAISHEEIARRVLDNPSTSHAAQLGTVWLPLPHILMLPLVWITPLYQSGVAGATVSMISFVITAVLLYKIVYRFTGSRFGGMTAAGIFALNANMLYMQSTPMTEALLFCTITATVYMVQRWAETGGYRYLVASACASAAAILSRYESWPIIFCLVFVVVAIAWQQRSAHITPKQLRGRTSDRFWAYVLVVGPTVFAWMLWSLLIDGNMLSFQNGEYAKASLWVDGSDIAIGHWWIALKDYCFAITDDIPWQLVLAAGVGLVVFAACEFRSKRSFTRALPVLSLLIIVPFFVVCLYSGQRPLRVMQVNGSYENVRFGLFVLLPCAIFAGYLVGRLAAVRFKPVRRVGGLLAVFTLVSALALTVGAYRGQRIVTLNEPKGFVNSADYIDQKALSSYLHASYDNRLVLMETVGNEVVTFYGLRPSELVSEGSYQLWQPALASPATNQIAWIIMRGGATPDKVYTAMTPGKLAVYSKVYTTADGNYTVYRRK